MDPSGFRQRLRLLLNRPELLQLLPQPEAIDVVETGV